MEDPLLLDKACYDLVLKLEHEEVNLKEIDRVVGPAMGAITLAHDIARHVSLASTRTCLRAYTEKETVDGKVLMVFKRTPVRSGERILLVEDVLTTGGSIESAFDAVADAHGTVLPYVGVLVNRSGITDNFGKKRDVA